MDDSGLLAAKARGTLFVVERPSAETEAAPRIRDLWRAAGDSGRPSEDVQSP